MGTWDDKPWDNDSAADWFGELFDATGLDAKVLDTLALDVEEHHREIRAAAAMLMFLGRVYIWPVSVLDERIRLAVAKLEAMAAMPEAEQLLPVDAVRAEAALLRTRLRDNETAPPEDARVSSAWDSLRD